MGRLKALKPGLAVLAPRLAPVEMDRDEERNARLAYRAWYRTERWRRLSWQVRLDAAFTCARCGRVEGRSGQTVCDHRRPHRGDPERFWDRENLQCLCKPCHDGAKQSEERRGSRA